MRVYSEEKQEQHDQWWTCDKDGSGDVILNQSRHVQELLSHHGMVNIVISYVWILPDNM